MHLIIDKLIKNNFMGKISRAAKQNLSKSFITLKPEQLEKLKNVAEVVLGVAAVAGVMYLSIAAPNALQLINKASWVRKTFKNRINRKSEQNRKITQTFYYLKAKGYIELEPAGDDFKVKIKEKGREKILQLNFQSLSVPKTSKWDKKWWIILSDIPTELKSQADLFRKKIKHMGLMTLQRSVWIYPFDPRNEIDFISKYYGLEQYVTSIKADYLDPQDELEAKLFFKLK